MTIPKVLIDKVLACKNFSEIEPVVVAFGGRQHLKAATEVWMNSIPARYTQSLFFANPNNLTGEGVAKWFDDAHHLLGQVVAEFGDDSREESVFTAHVCGFINACNPTALARAKAEMAPHLLDSWDALSNPA
ncbi:hypothetical protein [Pseudomonas kurunegalensis]|uniref:hypothetical protein n=1 Tax=Pseudomonas kurunegalensis TaxID=485880 RepID=UPI0040258B39